MQIESNIPVTPRTRAEYPFAQMQVGDSFLLETAEDGKRAAVAARHFGKRHNVSFVRRTQPGGQVRIWRIA